MIIDLRSERLCGLSKDARLALKVLVRVGGTTTVHLLPRRPTGGLKPWRELAEAGLISITEDGLEWHVQLKETKI